MSKAFEKGFLKFLFFFTLLLCPFLLKRMGMKNFLLTFLLNGLTNGIVDRFVVNRKLIKYPVRLLKRDFKIHILFDFLLYPVTSILINETTKKNGVIITVCKTLGFISVIVLVETWAEKYTKLIRWNKKWTWYYSFLSMAVKSLLNRMIIGSLRKTTTTKKTI
ncbi:CBO0543 family protein [Priestia filamentosa]|uniref:CBO0543 family protein n=1 Tax=Priestia filamentosa TaxID=1402861 RepID=UPI00398260C3